MKFPLLIFILCCSSISFSQKKYTKMFRFINDNDLYISTEQDRYYTNGMFFTYQFLNKTSAKKIAKKIVESQLGHHTYTPFKGTVSSVKFHDRPFAGYLFCSLGINKFYKNNNILKLSAEVGILGSSAFGKEMMKIVHDIYGFKDAIGWKHQIANAFALNLSGSYIKHLNTDASKIFDIYWHNKAKIGTVFTDFSTGFYGRIGFKPLQNSTNSIGFHSNLNNKNSNFNNEKEAFFYVKPTISYIVYDATIEGSFLNKNSPVTFDIYPFKFTTEFGVRFTSNRFNFGYSVFYHTKKLKSIRVPEGNFYGSIQISYLFN